ncbi:MAG: ribosomal RNA small subunit methyltransferase A [Acidobacteria bacterium]|nr:ribosomal RNA small subunit methyltransferase A [Acidobacteriota bacterium]
MGRRFGQHFLIRESILRRIAEAACGEREETVVEIGPGKGALTRQLLSLADRVVAIEVDPYLAGYLRTRFRESAGLTIVENDVLKTGLAEWGPAVIAGNLPYYITSPILSKVFATPGWKRAVFLVQREVAERVTAAPGTRDYGFLTVQTAVHAQAEFLFPVSPAAFAPPPKVESAVIRLTPRPDAVPDAAAFLEFAGLAFAHKRKTLRNNLKERYPAVAEAPEGGLRAEQLGWEQLADLHARLAAPPPK